MSAKMPYETDDNYYYQRFFSHSIAASLFTGIRNIKQSIVSETGVIYGRSELEEISKNNI